MPEPDQFDGQEPLDTGDGCEDFDGCPDCGATSDENCDEDCPSWDDDDG